MPGAEAQQRRGGEEGTDGDQQGVARGDHGEQQTAEAVADEQGALGDDPQQGAAEHEQVTGAEDVGEGGHASAGEHRGDDGLWAAPAERTPEALVRLLGRNRRPC